MLIILINQPHFAHSYQIFYRNFRAKAFGAEYARSLRFRYIVAGIFVPVALIVFLIAGLAGGSARLLSYGANLMFFLVGWHYVKQGYGILIVDSVQKRLFFSNSVKVLLRINGYACWLVSWLGLNHALSGAIRFIGLNYYTLPIPAPIYYVAIAVAAATAVAMLGALALQWRQARTLPWNGVIAYLMALYVWVVFIRVNPLFLLVVPTFHSLQYLVVVWRYQLSVERLREAPAHFTKLDRIWPDSVWRRLASFVALGTLLGYLGFMGLPYLLDAALPYDQRAFGPTLFLFNIFINIHHYFLDNVMWRRGNPHIQKYVFGRG